jgi:hypothetical protein
MKNNLEAEKKSMLNWYNYAFKTDINLVKNDAGNWLLSFLEKVLGVKLPVKTINPIIIKQILEILE